MGRYWSKVKNKPTKGERNGSGKHRVGEVGCGVKVFSIEGNRGVQFSSEVRLN